jgi:hypothetical protein
MTRRDATRLAALLLAAATTVARGADFRVSPYLQNPASDAVTIRWLSDAADPGSLSINGQTFASSPTLAATLDYQAAEAQAAGRATLIAMPGDLVESGGEQRDWDEFWRHAAGPYGTVAANTAIVPGLSNHENYGGPGALGGYSPAAATTAVAKYQTYFDLPDNSAALADHTGRYHRVDRHRLALASLRRPTR